MRGGTKGVGVGLGMWGRGLGFEGRGLREYEGGLWASDQSIYCMVSRNIKV